MKHNLLTKACWVLFFSFLLFTSSLRAQHFEWAKGYSSSQEGNQIIGSVTDSVGNLYILGTFRNTAAWDGGSHLLPMAPYGPAFNVTNVLIAKITPDGEMAWKKVIHANNSWAGNAYDIKPVGDTAFACLVAFPLPISGSNYCYYLDTLLTTTCDYPTPNGNMSHATRIALITFDFEGHVLEQHFLTLTFLDNDGNDIVRQVFNTDYYINTGDFTQPSFDIDQDGNVYLCRVGGDLVDQTYATWRGNVGGIKYWVDGRVVGQSEVRNSPLMWYPQLLKFSPHMDSLLASRYLVQRCDTNIEYQTDNLYLKLDYEGNPYVVGTISSSQKCDNTIIIDSLQNIFFSHISANTKKGYLFKGNTNLLAVQCMTLSDSIIHPDRIISNTDFHDIEFDEDSNFVFISAKTARGFFTDTSIFYSILMCQNIPLDNLRNDAFILVFSKQSDTLVYKTHARPTAKIASDLLSEGHGGIACKKNRIFIQLGYLGGLSTPENEIVFPNWSDGSLGLAVFDYERNIIDEQYYKAFSPNNKSGSISLRDSLLYLSNYLVSDATFGDIHVPAQGSCALIAKYVDASLMTPYEPPTVHITQADTTIVRLYPNPFGQKVNLECDGQEVRTAWLTDLTGRREEVRLQATGPGRYVLDLTGRPQATYLLTLVTADGQERTLRLLKQQDMFGE